MSKHSDCGIIKPTTSAVWQKAIKALGGFCWATPILHVRHIQHETLKLGYANSTSGVPNFVYGLGSSNVSNDSETPSGIKLSLLLLGVVRWTKLSSGVECNHLEAPGHATIF